MQELVIIYSYSREVIERLCFVLKFASEGAAWAVLE